MPAALLGAAAALLVACGSSGGGLIPASLGGPLQSDVEKVEEAAEEGNCSATESALLKTDQDYAALPSTVDSGLHDKIKLGIENLHKVAREACDQQLAQTSTATTPKTTSTATTTTQTTTPPTTSTQTTTTTTTPPPEHEEESAGGGSGGGTPAPGEGNGRPPGEGAGGAAPEESPAPGAEGGK